MIEIYNYIIQNTYEFLGVVFSIIYVSLSIKQNILCWPALIAAAAFNMYAYYLINLPLQTIMQFFFIGAALYGWYNWKASGNSITLKITRLTKQKHFKLISIGILATIVITIILNQLNERELMTTSHPFSDGLIFVFNIIPMYMMGKKIIESWIYFIVIDIYSGIFFYITEAYFFSFLFFCYIGFATYGYINWKKEVT